MGASIARPQPCAAAAGSPGGYGIRPYVSFCKSLCGFLPASLWEGGGPAGPEGENLATARNVSDNRKVLSPTACGRSPSGPSPSVATRHLPTQWGVTLAEGAKRCDNYPIERYTPLDKKVLVIIPCYNEEDNIVNTVENLRAECPEVDFLVVNDCSTDSSAELLRKHHYPFLDLPVNLGIGGNVQCGYLYAVRNGYDVAVQMDGDGQHDPAYLMEIVQPVLDGECDMCIGSRFVKKEGFQTSFMRRVGIRFLSGLIFLLSGHRVLDVTSGFRATNARMTAYFARHYAIDYPEPEAALAAILAGFKVAEAPVIMRERQGGVSSIHSFKSVYYMIKVSLALIIDRLSIRKSKGGRA